MKREIVEAIKAEVEHWPSATVSFEEGGKHPQMRLEFGGLIMRQAFSSTPSDVFAHVKILADCRRVLRKLDAKRDSEIDEAADKEAAERIYRKPNDGKAMRGDLVQGEPGPVKESMGEKLIKTGLVSAHEIVANRIETQAFETPEEEPVATRRMIDALVECGFKLAIVGDIDFAGVVGLAVDLIEDGIYFGLPDIVYHAVPRLSASGLQRLAVSPATFWRKSWLDPNKPELDEDETKARILGRAYHVARLEPDRFEANYARKIAKSDYPARGTVWNGDQIGLALADYGETKKRAGESVADQAQRLEDCGFEHTIFPLEEARWKAGLNGRIPLEAKVYDEIVADMERLRQSDDIAELLSSGEAEVSIFYTDRNGIQMKSRVDYLTRDWWDDFKTFDNTRGKELEQALADAVRYNRYHVQAVSYRDAVEAIRVGGLQIIGKATDTQRSLVAAIQIKPEELACWYIFQEKNGVPNLLAREFPFFDVPSDHALWESGASEEEVEAGRAAVRTKTGLHIRAIGDIDRAKRAFVLYSQVYEPGRPWAPINPKRAFEDADFNRFWLEGQN